MTTTTAHAPALPFKTALRSLLGSIVATSNAPRAKDVTHLNDRMLKDIGLERVDTMGVDARLASMSLVHRNLW